MLVIAFASWALPAAAHTADSTLAATARQRALQRAWSHELSHGGKTVSPLKRVVNLLKKMKAELDAESNKDSEMYDKMVCWCETNEKEKTKAIADAEAKDLDLTAEIEERSAEVGELATTIEALKKQIAEDTASLKTATALREKAARRFTETETDLVQTITNLRNAVGVLAKHQGGSLLQLSAPVVSGLRVVLRNVAMKYAELHGSPGVGSGHVELALLSIRSETQGKRAAAIEHALLGALDVKGESLPDSLPFEFAEQVVARSAGSVRTQLHANGGSFLQAYEQQPRDAAYKSYSARSGGIYGVMTQMLEEFEAQLSTAQKEEVQAREDFAALKKAKSEQIEIAKERLDDIEGGASENLKALSDAKEDLAMTRKQRSLDVEFLRNLKVTCNDLDKDWERRSATRSAEIQAVSETLAILSEDDSREMVEKSVTLLQEHASQGMKTGAAARRSKAAALLRRAAQAPDLEVDDLLDTWHGLQGASTVGVARGPKAQLSTARGPKAQLSTLALTVQLDSFTKIKQMIDTMVAELKKQQQDEVKFKAYCTKEFNANEKAVYAKNQEKKDIGAKLEKLAILMAKLAEDIAKAKKQIADTQVEIKKASENREGENAEFQTTVADQRATQVILKKALMRLKDFYKKSKGNKLVLDQQEPPVKFNKYKKNSGASPVMGLIEQIVEDSKKLVSEATSAEYKAQKDYEKFVTDSNGLIKELSEAVEAKTMAAATAKGESAEAKGDHESAIGELESLAAYEADLHGECDFVLKNFDIRQKARLQEMEAIQAAKGILSGAN